MTLRLQTASALEVEAVALLRQLTGVTAERAEVVPDAGGQRDLGIALGVATLVLTIPGAVLATLELTDRFERRNVKTAVEALKARLAETGGEAQIELPGGEVVDLARTGTDRVVDMLIEGVARR